MPLWKTWNECAIRKKKDNSYSFLTIMRHCLWASACVSRNRFCLEFLMTKASHTCHSSETHALWVTTVQSAFLWKVIAILQSSMARATEHKLIVPITLQFLEGNKGK